jgi:hypothetical protein
MTNSLDDEIDKKVGEVRYEAIDLSFGEIVNLHSDKEIFIQPDYQRLFRWTTPQRSKLIESIILELPIPPIFVIENSNGVLELIDGLQRVSSVIQFINSKVIGLDPLVLEGCDIVSELNGQSFETLSLRLKLRIKRASVRTVIIKRQSKSFLRYEMFKRLNTGGAILSPQEIRNCSARMIGDDGVKFYALIKELASLPSFIETIGPLPAQEKEQKGDEELVLRFFALKNAEGLFKGSVRDWLDDFMDSVLLETIKFDFRAETHLFTDLFNYIASVMGPAAFVRFKGELPTGALAPAYFEAVSMGVLTSLPHIRNLPGQTVKSKIIEAIQSEAFRSFTGPGANSREKLRGRIQTIQNALMEL